jgi:hypothetical protein
MKKSISLILPALLAGIVILVSAFGGGDPKYGSGAPAGYTNSPADGQNCSHCMGGSASAVTGWITSDVPASGYVPGTIYTITATATGTGNKGFEISPQTVTGTLIGTLIAGPGNHLVGSGKYVTQSSSVGGSSATWTFHWTAPATGVGDVTFYGSFIVGATNTKTTTLVIHQSTVGVQEIQAANWNFFPNPAHGSISVILPDGMNGHLSLDLFSIDGRMLRNLGTFEIVAGQHQLQADPDQPAGIYLLRLTGENGQSLRKLIVE